MMRFEENYLLDVWQYDNQTPPNKLYPYLVKKRGAAERSLDVSRFGKSDGYEGMTPEAFITNLVQGGFPRAATVRMKALNAPRLPASGWLIRNLVLSERELDVSNASRKEAARDLEEVTGAFEKQVRDAELIAPKDLEAKICTYPTIPRKIYVTSQAFLRNPYVVVKRLRYADGTCEHCRKPAPFLRKADGSPYLEVHHRIPLASGGADTYENTIALCPNCHRFAHFG